MNIDVCQGRVLCVHRLVIMQRAMGQSIPGYLGENFLKCGTTIAYNAYGPFTAALQPAKNTFNRHVL